VIIFIPAWSHIAENRWNACWRLVVQMVAVPNRLRKANGWPSSSRQWHHRRLGCDYQSNSYRLWKGMVTAHTLVETHSHGEQLWFNSTDPNKLLIGNTVTWRPLTASNSTAVNTELPQQTSKLFTRYPIVGFLEINKTCVDVFGILPRFFENLVCSGTARTKTVPGSIQLWFDWFKYFSKEAESLLAMIF